MHVRHFLVFLESTPTALELGVSEAQLHVPVPMPMTWLVAQVDGSVVVNPVADGGKAAAKAHRRLSAFSAQGLSAVHPGGAAVAMEMATMGQAAPPNMGAVVNEVSVWVGWDGSGSFVGVPCMCMCLLWAAWIVVGVDVGVDVVRVLEGQLGCVYVLS